MSRTTTIGKLLVESVLPEEYRGRDLVLDKKGLSSLLSDIAKKYPEKYGEVAKKLGDIGYQVAQESGGYSIGLRHLRKSKASINLQKEFEKNLAKILENDDLTDKQRDELILRLSGKLLEKQQAEVFDEAASNANPVALQVLAGGKGGKQSVSSLIGSDVLYTDHRDRVIPVPVLRSYSQGLSPAEFWAASYGARRGVIATKVPIRDAGALAKQLNQVAHRLIVMGNDDDSGANVLRGLPVDTDDLDSEGSLLSLPAGGYEKDTVITPKILRDLRNKGIKRILVRSPISSHASDGGVYAKDVGIREYGSLPGKGSAVGMTAVQALTEPISQAQLCLAKGTRVQLANGASCNIEDIVPGEYVLGSNVRGHTFPVRVKAVYQNGSKECFRYLFKHGDVTLEVECTEDHKILSTTSDPDGDIKHPRPVGLGVESLSAVLEGGDRFAVRIGKKPIGYVPTYDIEVDHKDHLFVLTNGLIVSNSAKHSGGVAGQEKAVSGMAAIQGLLHVPKQIAGGATHAERDGTVDKIERSPAGGFNVWIDGEPHYVSEGLNLKVKPGDTVEAGDILSSGLPNVGDIVRHKGIGEGRRYFVDIFRNTLGDMGLKIHRRNAELLSRALINHVKLTDDYEDGLPDDVVPYSDIASRYKPREGSYQVAPKKAVGKYLESPVLHYTIGTKIRKSMIPDLARFGVESLQVHDEPPPFEPYMVRANAHMQYDPDALTRFYGTGMKKSLLETVHRGRSSNEAGTSFVPGLMRAEDFGRIGAVRPSERGMKLAEAAPSPSPAPASSAPANPSGSAPKPSTSPSTPPAPAGKPTSTASPPAVAKPAPSSAATSPGSAKPSPAVAQSNAQGQQGSADANPLMTWIQNLIQSNPSLAPQIASYVNQMAGSGAGLAAWLAATPDVWSNWQYLTGGQTYPGHNPQAGYQTNALDPDIVDYVKGYYQKVDEIRKNREYFRNRLNEELDEAQNYYSRLHPYAAAGITAAALPFGHKIMPAIGRALGYTAGSLIKDPLLPFTAPYRLIRNIPNAPNFLSEVYQSSRNLLDDKYQSVRNFGRALGSRVGSAYGAVRHPSQTLAGLRSGVVRDAGRIADLFKHPVNTLRSAASTGWSAGSTAVRGAGTWVGSGYGLAKNTAKGVFDTLGDAYRYGRYGIKPPSSTSGLVKGIADFASSVYTDALKPGFNYVAGSRLINNPLVNNPLTRLPVTGANYAYSSAIRPAFNYLANTRVINNPLTRFAGRGLAGVGRAGFHLGGKTLSKVLSPIGGVVLDAGFGTALPIAMDIAKGDDSYVQAAKAHLKNNFRAFTGAPTIKDVKITRVRDPKTGRLVPKVEYVYADDNVLDQTLSMISTIDPFAATKAVKFLTDLFGWTNEDQQVGSAYETAAALTGLGFDAAEYGLQQMENSDYAIPRETANTARAIATALKGSSYRGNTENIKALNRSLWGVPGSGVGSGKPRGYAAKLEEDLAALGAVDPNSAYSRELESQILAKAVSAGASLPYIRDNPEVAAHMANVAKRHLDYLYGLKNLSPGQKSIIPKLELLAKGDTESINKLMRTYYSDYYKGTGVL